MSGVQPIDQQVGVKYLTITARVCAVKKDLGPVPKNGYNSHGKYHHSTTDDVYHAVRPLMAKHGLDLRISIVSREMVEYKKYDHHGNETTGYRLDYEFGIRLEAIDGSVEDATDRRFLSLPYTGPQTDETAMSYASKQYLRQRFQIETGDFESETELDEDGGNGAARRRNAVTSTPEGKRISAMIDDALPHLSPNQVRHVQTAREACNGIGELNALWQNVQQVLKDQPPARRAPNGNGNGRARSSAQPAARAPQPLREGKWWLGAAVKVGDDDDGNPVFGARLPPNAGIPPIGAPVKVTMKGKSGRQRAVITKILDQSDEGVTVATRTMTRMEQSRLEAPAEEGAAE